jgi:hypothetical protein
MKFFKGHLLIAPIDGFPSRPTTRGILINADEIRYIGPREDSSSESTAYLKNGDILALYVPYHELLDLHAPVSGTTNPPGKQRTKKRRQNAIR